MNARWIRLGAVEPLEFDAACARLAAAQLRASLPVLAWGQAQRQYLFALVVPLKHAPGRSTRWLSWALNPAVATYRQFGYRAYLEAQSLWLYGRKIADASVQTIGECMVVASSFLLRFPEACVITPSAELEQAFRLRLEAQHGWQFDHSWPTEPETARYAHA